MSRSHVYDISRNYSAEEIQHISKRHANAARFPTKHMQLRIQREERSYIKPVAMLRSLCSRDNVLRDRHERTELREGREEEGNEN